MHRYFMAFLLLATGLVCCCSCHKDSGMAEAVFYGKWKASYGDTVTFARINGKNRIYYNIPMPPSATQPEKEFAYRNGKLLLNENAALSLGFRELHSFTWVQTGAQFTVQNVEWFPFLSSISTYTFTRIP